MPESVGVVMSTTKVYRLPAMFVEDWLYRMDGTPLIPDKEKLIVRPRTEKGTTVVLQLNQEQHRGLLCDAKHYSENGDDYWCNSVRSLSRSASRVLAALRKDGQGD